MNLSRLMNPDALIVATITLVILGLLAAQAIRVRRGGVTIRSQAFFALIGTTTAMTLLFSGIVVAGELYVLASEGALDWSATNRVLATTLPNVAFLVVTFAGAAGLASILIGRFIVTPIEKLTSVARSIADGAHDVFLERPRSHELAALSDAFQAMHHELEQREVVESLAADLSHELKNPVASIRASAEVLEAAVGEDPDAARQFARRIGESARTLDALSTDLLDLARLQARKSSPGVPAIDLLELAREGVAAAEVHAERKQIDLQLVGSGPVSAPADAVWVRRAVDNLLSNAIEFTPDGGTITVSVGSAGDRVQIDVADTGSGVDPGIRDRLFERFATTRHGEGGTGLGLSIVRAVASSHGGRAFLRSTGAGGSCFALELPA